MADAGRAPDTTNWNPVFAQRLQAFRDALTKAGIQTTIQSGYRSPEYQNQMYQNHLAKAAHQPLPFPNVEAPSVVAPAWRSFHNYGIAADMTPANPADYQRMWDMANQFGLTALRQQDRDHFQLAGTLDQNIKQYNLAGWRPEGRPAPDTGAIAYGGPPAGQPPPSMVARGGPVPAAPAAPAGSPAAQHEAFIRDYAAKIGLNPDVALGVARAEGMNAVGFRTPNQASTVDVSGGKPFSFGDFQLNTRGGMGADALKAGIDPADAAQWQKADIFALDQMKSGGLAPWKGDPFAAKWMASGQPITGGTTLTSTPPGVVDPSIVARGGTSPPLDASGGTAVAAAAPAPANTGNALQRLLTKPPPTKDAQGNEVEGKSPLQKIAGAVGDVAQKPAPEVAPLQPAMPVQDPDPGLAPAASQLFQTVQQAAMRPLTWSSRPYGWNAGQQLGTTLNATGYGNG